MSSSISIPSPNTDRSLLSIAALRSAAGIADNSKDEELTALGRYVSAVITKACKVAVQNGVPPTLRLETVTQTTRFDARREHLVLLRSPVIEVASLTEDGAALSETTDFRIENGMLRRLSGAGVSCWAHGADIVITYSAGWSTVPDDLEFAARKFVAEEYQSGGRDRLLKSKTTEGVSSYEWWVDPTKDRVIPADVMSILEDGGYVNRWLA